MGEMIVAHDISHGLKANQQVRTGGLRRRDTSDVALCGWSATLVFRQKCFLRATVTDC
jgi:hypothetical protein